MKLPERSEGNFFMFLKLTRAIYPKLLWNILLIVNYTLHDPTYIVSYLWGILSTFRS